MSSVSRKAVLISYPGIEGKDNYCPGVFTDIKKYREFLQNPLGGAWKWNPTYDSLSEIKIFPSPSKAELSSYLNNIRSYDYVIIAFCGHGGYSLRNKQTQIEINQQETMLESELKGAGIRRNLILDCCRVLLSDLITDSVENFGMKLASEATQKRILNAAECREYYDTRISECAAGINVLYGCNITEKSGESEHGGGYYSSSLIRAAHIWEKEMNKTLPSDKYSIFTIPEAHASAVPLVQRKKKDQNPQIATNGIRFPWAIASY